MPIRNINSIRSKFIEYFSIDHSHVKIKSSSLIPVNDPSLMFVNSGMVQFKNIFTGIEKVSYTRAVTAQKCVRAGGKHNDLENVGYTARHHTFFEMLGNFSFGDYFKEQAIFYAWDLLTKVFCLDKQRLYVTVFHTDTEAANLWKKIAGLSEERIIKISSKDNFWSMGDTGPCGPCSEIFYDNGEHVDGGLPGSAASEGPRFVEIWNMVFMQYEQIDKNTRIDLPEKCIDTGMGLERIAAVLQNVTDNYDTDAFQEIIEKIEDLTKVAARETNRFMHRIIADHLRSASFLIADGVVPSNEGRGYVLRRIMRRAMRQVHQLGYRESLMHQLVPSLIENMGEVYPELKTESTLISDTLLLEEDKFKLTLSKGLKILTDQSKDFCKGDVLPGKTAFMLYDTYGFPLDLTEDILKQRGISVNHQEFDLYMQEQKSKAREAWQGSGDSIVDSIWFDIKSKFGATEFLGYSLSESEGKVLALISEGSLVSIVDKVQAEFQLVTNQTPFYAESGGQMGDIGTISYGNLRIKVLNTKKYLNEIYAHTCVLESGIVEVGSVVKLSIDSAYRHQLQGHHSATHILHKVVKVVLGESVTQKGSLVAHDKLRFDINYPKAITSKQLTTIEEKVNRIIIDNTEVEITKMPIDKAMSYGATALFGEKYGEEVRVVSMGSDSRMGLHHSIELCGGTHVKRTGEIGYFKIISESAIAAGIRRIEAVAGIVATTLAREDKMLIAELTSSLNSSKSELLTKVDSLISSKSSLERQLHKFQCKNLAMNEEDIAKEAQLIGDIRIVVKSVQDFNNVTIIRSAVQETVKQTNNLIFIITSYAENRYTIVVGVTKDISEAFPANQLINIISSYLESNSKGGGNSILAQVGGSYDLSKVNKLLEELIRHVQKTL